MSTLHRLTGNSAANGYGILASTSVQLVTVPALLWAWGVHGFGVWTMMATIPAYLALSDMGFTEAAGSEMALRFARGDRDGSRRVFQTTAILLSLLSAAIVLAAGVVIFLLSASGLAGDWLREQALVLFGLIAYAILALLSRVSLLALRATGHYAVGTFVYESMVLVEGVAVIAVALAGGGYHGAVTALIVARALNIAVLYPIMRRYLPWLRYCAHYASRSEARYLLPRALGALVIPSVTAVQVQMSVLVVGAILSPSAVAVYVPVRTASRIAVTLVYGISNATMPEISAASATEDRGRLSKLVVGNLLLIVGFLLPGGLLFGAFGGKLIALWTGGKLSAGLLFVLFMGLAMVMHGAWNILARMLLAISEHGGLALALCLLSFFSLPLMALGAYLAGLAGAAASSLFMESVYLLCAVLFSRHHLIVKGHMRTGLQSIAARVLAKIL